MGIDRSRNDPGIERLPNDGVGFPFPPVDEGRLFDIIDTMKSIAVAHDVSAAQVALAWLLAQSAVTSVISGVKRPDQLADNLAALILC